MIVQRTDGQTWMDAINESGKRDYNSIILSENMYKELLDRFNSFIPTDAPKLKKLHYVFSNTHGALAVLIDPVPAVDCMIVTINDFNYPK